MTTPTSFSNHTADAVRLGAKAVDAIHETAYDAKDAAAEAAREAKYEFQKLKYEMEKVAAQTQKLAKENPFAAAATMFGVGALVGALAYKLLSPRPTVARVLGVNHLPESARKQFSKQLKYLKKMF